MADLGEIADEYALTPVPVIRFYPYLGDRNDPSISVAVAGLGNAPHIQDGVVSGVVANAAGPQPNTRVTLHWHHDMRCVGITWTNAAGEYQFTGLPAGSTRFKFMVIRHTPPGSPTYRPLAHGPVQPYSLFG